MLGPAERAEIIDFIYSEQGLPNACKKAGQALRIVMDEMDADESFHGDVQRALGRLTAIGEQELFRRAVHGTESYVTSQGRLVRIPDPDLPGATIPLIERKYSDTLLTQFMKARARDTFGDKVEVNHHHSGHIAIPIISAEALMRALETGSPLDFTPQAVIDAEFALITDERPVMDDFDDEPDFSMDDAELGFGI